VSVKLRFEIGDRVILADDSSYYSQNKDKNGNVYGGTIVDKFMRSRKDDFHYIVKWDKGANSHKAYYPDGHLIPEQQHFDNNKQASTLLSKEY
jgi:hypothetical protein